MAVQEYEVRHARMHAAEFFVLIIVDIRRQPLFSATKNGEDVIAAQECGVALLEMNHLLVPIRFDRPNVLFANGQRLGESVEYTPRRNVRSRKYGPRFRQINRAGAGVVLRLQARVLLQSSVARVVAE